MRGRPTTTRAVHVLDHARIDAAPKGTGDLFSAVVTARLLAGCSLVDAAQHACDSVVAAVALTHARQSAELLLPD